MALADTLALAVLRRRHRRFAERACRAGPTPTLPTLPHDDVDDACRARVKALGEAGIPQALVPASTAGLHPQLDVRTLCLAREILAFHDGLADFAFAMQGLGTGSISLFGSDGAEARYLPPVRDGKAIAAFALSEPEAGSDVAALAMTAKPDGNAHVRLNGEKTWISNGGIADHYVVFARTGEAPGARGLSAFVVDADTPGLERRRAHRGDRAASAGAACASTTCACRWPTGSGKPGEGFKVAMATLDMFRSTVGAAALGFARRALHENARARRDAQDVRRAARRPADDARPRSPTAPPMSMPRRCWSIAPPGPRINGAARVTREAAMAKR